MRSFHCTHMYSYLSVMVHRIQFQIPSFAAPITTCVSLCYIHIWQTMWCFDGCYENVRDELWLSLVQNEKMTAYLWSWPRIQRQSICIKMPAVQAQRDKKMGKKRKTSQFVDRTSNNEIECSPDQPYTAAQHADSCQVIHGYVARVNCLAHTNPAPLIWFRSVASTAFDISHFLLLLRFFSTELKSFLTLFLYAVCTSLLLLCLSDVWVFSLHKPFIAIKDTIARLVVSIYSIKRSSWHVLWFQCIMLLCIVVVVVVRWLVGTVGWHHKNPE